MEQYIDYTVASDLPMVNGMVYVCAWCNRVKVPGSDAMNPHSWNVVEQHGYLKSDIYLSHGICPRCKAEVKA